MVLEESRLPLLLNWTIPYTMCVLCMLCVCVCVLVCYCVCVFVMCVGYCVCVFVIVYVCVFVIVIVCVYSCTCMQYACMYLRVFHKR